MARIGKSKKLRPSILDRLLDDDPGAKSETDPGQHHYVRQLRDSLRRDLENLLNARRYLASLPSDLYEAEKSLLNYGLPDLATVNIIDAKKRNEFAERLQKTLLEFEPRFKSVKVSYVDATDSNDRTLHFRIDAIVYAEPQPEVIVFDSALESVTRMVSVKEI